MIALAFQRPLDNPLSYISNGYANYYQIRPGVWNYHTGIDVVAREGSCAGWPIQAAAWGVVTYAERVTAEGYTAWGHLIVIRHDLVDGTVVYSRSAHSEAMYVKAGDMVHPGQHIADVGNAFGVYPYHLHFDISKTDVLARCPWDWPGIDLERVYQDYLDPVAFMKGHGMTADFSTLEAALANAQAALNDVLAAESALKQQLNPPAQPTTPTTPTAPAAVTMYVTAAEGVHVRTSPQALADGSNVAGGLAYRAAIDVVDAVVAGWKQIVGGQYDKDYVSASYLSTTRPQ